MAFYWSTAKTLSGNVGYLALRIVLLLRKAKPTRSTCYRITTVSSSYTGKNNRAEQPYTLRGFCNKFNFRLGPWKSWYPTYSVRNQAASAKRKLYHRHSNILLVIHIASLTFLKVAQSKSMRVAWNSVRLPSPVTL